MKLTKNEKWSLDEIAKGIRQMVAQLRGQTQVVPDPLKALENLAQSLDALTNK